jgi:hypothetical protein
VVDRLDWVYLVRYVVGTRSTHAFVGFADLSDGIPATYTIRLVETFRANADTGWQLEIGSVEAMVAHLQKVVKLIKIYGYLWIQFLLPQA